MVGHLNLDGGDAKSQLGDANSQWGDASPLQFKYCFLAEVESSRTHFEALALALVSKL